MVGTVQSLTYAYDGELPLVTSVSSPSAGESWTYGYDDGYRLASSTNVTSPSDSQTFAYDSLGRMTYNSRLGSYVYPADGQPRPHAPTSANGSAYTYYANGNLKAGGGRTPTWDTEGRLSAIGTTSFSYDGFGERLKKTSSQGTSLYPFGDDYEITKGVITRYISVDGLGVIAKRVGTGTSLRTYWLHTDRLGSINAITSDGNGQPAGSLVFRRDYRPYGETRSQSGTHTESRGWIDQRNDLETGLTYLHARYFDPKLGIFLSPDRLDPMRRGVDLNRYAYGFGNPVNVTDPSGLAGTWADCSDGSGDTCWFELGGQDVVFEVGPGGTSAGGWPGNLLALFFGPSAVNPILAEPAPQTQEPATGDGNTTDTNTGTATTGTSGSGNNPNTDNNKRKERRNPGAADQPFPFRDPCSAGFGDRFMDAEIYLHKTTAHKALELFHASELAFETGVVTVTGLLASQAVRTGNWSLVAGWADSGTLVGTAMEALEAHGLAVAAYSIGVPEAAFAVAALVDARNSGMPQNCR